jgi:cell division protein FtsW
MAEEDLPADEIYEEEAMYSIEDNSRNPMNAVLNK